MLIKVADLTVYAPPEKQGRLWQCTKDWVQRRSCVRQDSVPAVKKLSCTFARGVNVVLGPNGSGKTILLQVLAGLVLPNLGSVVVDESVANPLVLRHITSYLPQTFGLYPKLTAREMLEYIAVLKGIVDKSTRERNVETVLRQMGLVAVAEQKVGGYSRGMRQKVGIAQTLLGDPPILIVDEPTAGLDPEERIKLRGLFAQIGQERVVVWASSIITDTSCADRVLVLDQGKSCFEGTPFDLAACSRLPNNLQLTPGKTANEHWTEVLKQGYLATLLDGVHK